MGFSFIRGENANKSLHLNVFWNEIKYTKKPANSAELFKQIIQKYLNDRERYDIMIESKSMPILLRKIFDFRWGVISKWHWN